MNQGPDKSTLEHLLAEAEAKVWSKRPEGRRFLGVRAAPAWSGPSEIEVHGRRFRVESCVSGLEMRERLERLEADGRDAVLLCPRDDRELGDDILGRLAKQRLMAVDARSSLCGLFGASEIDARVLRRPRLVEVLLSHAPAGGFPTVGVGFLSLEHATNAVLHQVLRFPLGALDGRALLRWAYKGVGPRVWSSLGAAVRDEIRPLITEANRAGPLAMHVLKLAELGREQDALAIGTVLTELAPGDETLSRARRDARIRLETQSGLVDLDDETSQRWAEATEAELNQLEAAEDGAATGAILHRAEHLLVAARGADLAGAGRVLASSYRARLKRLGEAVKALLAGDGSRDAVAQAVASTEEHRAANGDRRTSRSLKAVRRLVDWLAQPTDVPNGLQTATLHYLDDGSWVDAERGALGFQIGFPPFDDALSALASRVTAVRATQNRAFGSLIAEVGTRPFAPAEVIGVESVLTELVAPAVDSKHAVLLLVFDGLSAAIFHQLIEDITLRGWTRVALPSVNRGRTTPRAAIAALPTVTEVSRMSLFSGAVGRGIASDEARAFSEHPALVGATSSRKPPRLFHKAEVGSGGSLDPELADALLDEKQAVVGVVINAVDDALGKTDQLDLEFDVVRIKPLAPILEICRIAGRRIVIASDHGHIVESGSRLKNQPGGGLRWRRGSEGGEEEVLIRGPRVVGDDVIVPWSETLRYGPKQAGYHGGVTPQEVVVPLALLEAGPDLEGRGLQPSPPRWWCIGRTASPPPLATVVANPTNEAARAVKPVAPKAGELPFDLDGPDPWIEGLLASEVFRAQRKSASRFSLADQQIFALLRPLAERGGRASLPMLAAAIGLHESRAAGMIEALRRVLNLDGYSVLTYDSAAGDVTLNIPLLKEQFGA